MKIKKSVVKVCLGVSAVFIALSLCGCEKNNTKNNENNNQSQISTISNVVEKSENKIDINATEPYTGETTFEFEANPYQPLILKINRRTDAGFMKINVENNDINRDFRLMEFLDNEDEAEYELVDGNGKYVVAFEMENFKGQYSLTLEKGPQYETTEYVSDYGYKFSYVEDKFEISKENGKEIFKLKMNEESIQEYGEVYVAFYKMSAANKDKEIAAIKNEAERIGDCYFDNRNLSGQFASSDNIEGNGRSSKDVFMIDLKDGSVLFMERRGSRTGNKDIPGETFIYDIIDTISYNQ